MTSTTAVMWFRRDLRLRDNPALRGALAGHDKVLPLFVLDRHLLRPAGAPRVAHLLSCLRELREATDGRLVVTDGDPIDVVPRWAREVDADEVWCAEDFGPYGAGRDDAVEQRLEKHDLALRRSGSSYAVPPATLFGSSGDPYKVFTPFFRAWSSHGWSEPVPAPRNPTWVEAKVGRLPAAPPVDAELPEAGEQAAHHVLDRFLDRVSRYADDRDRPDLDHTSRLSPHLHAGSLHPRQVLARLGRGKGAETFRSELCWREFYADVLFHRPDSARRAYRDELSGMQLDSGRRADEKFEAWCQGRTGFPIVDAGMRQLLGEAWLHNRVRMIVASFLVKDLHIDWTRGARWFMEHLVDGDLASNQHSWQWVAGTGTDAAPYFRVFNPITQGKRFDPDGDYVRRWVPELRHLAGAAAHEPWRAGRDGGLFNEPSDYPDRIVDHAVEREEALRRYGAARRGR